MALYVDPKQVEANVNKLKEQLMLTTIDIATLSEDETRMRYLIENFGFDVLFEGLLAVAIIQPYIFSKYEYFFSHLSKNKDLLEYIFLFYAYAVICNEVEVKNNTEIDPKKEQEIKSFFIKLFNKVYFLKLEGKTPEFIIKEIRRTVAKYQFFPPYVDDPVVERVSKEPESYLELFIFFLKLASLLYLKKIINDTVFFSKMNDQKSLDNVSKIMNDIYQFINLKNIMEENTLSLEDLTLNKQKVLSNIISTGLEIFDGLFEFGRGYRKKTLTVVTGASGIGKSKFVVFLGAQALKQGFKVLHIISENDPDETQEDYLSVLLGRKFNFVEDIDKIDELNAKYNLNNVKILTFKPGEFTPSNIKSAIIKYKFSGFDPDVVIIDSINLMKDDEGSSDKFTRGENIIKDLFFIAREYDTAIISTLQFNRQGIKASKGNIKTKDDEEDQEYYDFQIGMSDTSSLSYAILNYAHHFITLNQNYKEMPKNLMRIYVEKIRRGASNVIFPIYFDKGNMICRDVTREELIDNFSEKLVNIYDKLVKIAKYNKKFDYNKVKETVSKLTSEINNILINDNNDSNSKINEVSLVKKDKGQINNDNSSNQNNNNNFNNSNTNIANNHNNNNLEYNNKNNGIVNSNIEDNIEKCEFDFCERIFGISKEELKEKDPKLYVLFYDDEFIKKNIFQIKSFGVNKTLPEEKQREAWNEIRKTLEEYGYVVEQNEKGECKIIGRGKVTKEEVEKKAKEINSNYDNENKYIANNNEHTNNVSDDDEMLNNIGNKEELNELENKYYDNIDDNIKKEIEKFEEDLNNGLEQTFAEEDLLEEKFNVDTNKQSSLNDNEINSNKNVDVEVTDNLNETLLIENNSQGIDNNNSKDNNDNVVDLSDNNNLTNNYGINNSQNESDLEDQAIEQYLKGSNGYKYDIFKEINDTAIVAVVENPMLTKDKEIIVRRGVLKAFSKRYKTLKKRIGEKIDKNCSVTYVKAGDITLAYIPINPLFIKFDEKIVEERVKQKKIAEILNKRPNYISSYYLKPDEKYLSIQLRNFKRYLEKIDTDKNIFIVYDNLFRYYIPTERVVEILNDLGFDKLKLEIYLCNGDKIKIAERKENNVKNIQYYNIEEDLKYFDNIVVPINGYVKKNGEAVMGAGIAKLISKKIPDITKIVGEKINEKFETKYLGKFVIDGEKIGVITFPSKPKYIIIESEEDYNKILDRVRDKFDFGDIVPGFYCKSDLSRIMKSCHELLYVIKKHDLNNIAMPLPGTGNGGLNEEDVIKVIINSPLVYYHDRIFIFTNKWKKQLTELIEEYRHFASDDFKTKEQYNIFENIHKFSDIVTFHHGYYKDNENAHQIKYGVLKGFQHLNPIISHLIKRFLKNGQTLIDQPIPFYNNMLWISISTLKEIPKTGENIDKYVIDEYKDRIKPNGGKIPGYYLKYNRELMIKNLNEFYEKIKDNDFIKVAIVYDNFMRKSFGPIDDFIDLILQTKLVNIKDKIYITNGFIIKLDEYMKSKNIGEHNGEHVIIETKEEEQQLNKTINDNDNNNNVEQVKLNDNVRYEKFEYQYLLNPIDLNNINLGLVAKNLNNGNGSKVREIKISNFDITKAGTLYSAYHWHKHEDYNEQLDRLKSLLQEKCGLNGNEVIRLKIFDDRNKCKEWSESYYYKTYVIMDDGVKFTGLDDLKDKNKLTNILNKKIYCLEDNEFIMLI